jgi:hypothetical protein
MLGTTEYEVLDDRILVRFRSLTQRVSYEVPFRNINPTPVFNRSVPLLWAVFALVFGGVGLMGLYGSLFANWAPDKVSMFTTALFFGAACFLCVMGFLKKKVDIVVFRSTAVGSPALILNRTLPTTRHVEEFISIVKERIEASKTGWKDDRP